jgi:alpha-L-fucosidase 2
MIIRQLLTSTIKASERLNIDAAFRKKMQQVLTKLAPTQVGRDGRIMEWTEEFPEPEPGHRHISHLYGLYPGNEINTKQNSALMKAAEQTISHRLANGGGHTGWSRAWIINFFARMNNAEKAHENLVALLRKSTLPNLFDNHPPFQIDGNFGATAGITEMLVQSHAGEIVLLPALPKEWRNGSIKGICARGGFELDITWKEGVITDVSVLSKLGNTCILRYGDKIVTQKTTKGQRFNPDF